jgi:hypothetical protein
MLLANDGVCDETPGIVGKGGIASGAGIEGPDYTLGKKGQLEAAVIIPQCVRITQVRYGLGRQSLRTFSIPSGLGHSS